MPTIWFALVALMITAYVVLDGFDLGVGAVHLFLGKSDAERQLLIRTIGPVWDANEVWLIAGGGTLFFSFPLLYASSFSGFYLPLTMVLWLLVFRGIGVELRGHVQSDVWRGLFDGCFAIGSTLLAVFYGAALANVVRGVPIGNDGYFFEPLWTDWRVGKDTGILDWYTVPGGILALLALMLHGCNYIALKTSGDLQLRARKYARRLWLPVVLLTAFGIPATVAVIPHGLQNYSDHPLLFAVPALVVASLVLMLWMVVNGNDWGAFLGSCLYLVAMLSGAAIAQYPVLLRSSADAANNITIYNAATGHFAMSVGLIWWGCGMVLAIGYFVFVYRMFRGKVAISAGHG